MVAKIGRKTNFGKSCQMTLEIPWNIALPVTVSELNAILFFYAEIQDDLGKSRQFSHRDP